MTNSLIWTLERAGAGAPESRSLRGPGPGIKGFVEDLAGAGLAGATARGDAGTGLQLLERAHAIFDGLVQALFGDTVADADVHALTLGRHRSGEEI
jgi:hypothetical protein